MICASSEAESKRLVLVRGKSGRCWLYDPDGADCYVEGGPDSGGFGGRVITFTLLDGTQVQWKGPWHSNTNALFLDTGVDLRNKHLTWGCVGLGRKGNTITDVIWFDDRPTMGAFDRVESKARELAAERNCPVFVYMQSQGGSLTAMIGAKNVD